VSYFYLDASTIVKRYSPETGSAWIRSSLTFVAADGDLLAAAQAEGLSIENPNLHP
jgi:hypothetical protein